MPINAAETPPSLLHCHTLCLIGLQPFYEKSSDFLVSLLNMCLVDFCLESYSLSPPPWHVAALEETCQSSSHST